MTSNQRLRENRRVSSLPALVPVPKVRTGSCVVDGNIRGILYTFAFCWLAYRSRDYFLFFHIRLLLETPLLWRKERCSVAALNASSAHWRHAEAETCIGCRNGLTDILKFPSSRRFINTHTSSHTRLKNMGFLLTKMLAVFGDRGKSDKFHNF